MRPLLALGVLIASGLAVWLVFRPPPGERLATLLEEKRWEEAEALAQQAVGGAAPEEQPAFYRGLAIAHGRQGEHRDAIAAYRAARVLRPDDDDLRHRIGIEITAIGRDHEERGDFDLALQRYREAVQTAPEIPHGHDALIEALRTRGTIDARIAAIRAALEAGAPSVLYRLELARLLATHPDPNKRDARTALELSQEALMHDRTPDTLQTYAIAAAALGDYEAALRHQLDAIELAGGKDAPGFDERRVRLQSYIDHLPNVQPDDAADRAQ